jgi:hypothetical protein
MALKEEFTYMKSRPNNLINTELNPYASGEEPNVVYQRVRDAIEKKIDILDKIQNKTQAHRDQLERLFNDLNNAAEDYMYAIGNGKKYCRP